MSEYIELPIDTDPEDLLADAYDDMQTQVPGWAPAEGQPDTQILKATVVQAAESRDVMSAVPKSIFRTFGDTIVQLPPVDAQTASGVTTWTVVDALGYTIPAGTQIGITDASGNVIPFETIADVVIPVGSVSTGAGEVDISAVNPGAAGTDLAGPVELLDILDFVSTVTLVGTTSGGVDAETDDTYISRLSDEMTLIAPTPILPADFMKFARRVPGVWRAVVLDGYNPADDTFNNERMITVAAQDSAGAPVSAGVKTAIAADLESRRETNFVCNTMNPSVNLIDTNYTVMALSGFDPAALKATIDAAIIAFFNPSLWATSQTDPLAWENVTVARYLELVTAISNVPGVDYIQALTFGIHAGAIGAVDVNLVGRAPLPTSNIITGLVNTP